MRAPATPAERLRDAVALALLVGGAGLFLYGFRGLQALAAGQISVAPGEWAVTQWTRLRSLSFAGIALVVLGVAMAVYSYVRRARARGERAP